MRLINTCLARAVKEKSETNLKKVDFLESVNKMILDKSFTDNEMIHDVVKGEECDFIIRKIDGKNHHCESELFNVLCINEDMTSDDAFSNIVQCFDFMGKKIAIVDYMDYEVCDYCHGNIKSLADSFKEKEDGMYCLPNENGYNDVLIKYTTENHIGIENYLIVKTFDIDDEYNRDSISTVAVKIFAVIDYDEYFLNPDVHHYDDNICKQFLAQLEDIENVSKIIKAISLLHERVISLTNSDKESLRLLLGSKLEELTSPVYDSDGYKAYKKMIYTKPMLTRYIEPEELNFSFVYPSSASEVDKCCFRQYLSTQYIKTRKDLFDSLRRNDNFFAIESKTGIHFVYRFNFNDMKIESPSFIKTRFGFIYYDSNYKESNELKMLFEELQKEIEDKKRIISKMAGKPFIDVIAKK